MAGLEKHVIVITGASSGIGRAIALGFANPGSTLCLIGRNLESLRSLADTARADGAHVHCYRIDLMRGEDVAQLAKTLEEDHGGVDVLVHSAGAIRLGSMENAHVDSLDWQYGINLRAPYVLTQALLPMLKRCQGQIVFINSSVGVNARGIVGQYAATKHALRAISDSLREEVNEYGIRVLSIFPGRTATPMQAAIHATEGRTYQPELLLQPEDVALIVIHALNLPRTAEVTDIHIRPTMKLKHDGQ